jgi:hypothetical protein
VPAFFRAATLTTATAATGVTSKEQPPAWHHLRGSAGEIKHYAFSASGSWCEESVKSGRCDALVKIGLK